MVSRRTALKGAVAAALITQPIRAASVLADATSPTAETPRPFSHPMYGSAHPLAQGETVMIPAAPEKPILEAEEISTRVVPRRRRSLPFKMRRDANVEDLLRVRLEDESRRYCAAEWSTYKHELRKVEQLLLAAGVDGETVKWAIDDLDCAAVGLHGTTAGRMLEVGIDAGRKLADASRPSPILLPGDHTCTACHGSGGKHDDCATCEGTGLADEPGPALMLILIPDGVALEETELEDLSAAA